MDFIWIEIRGNKKERYSIWESLSYIWLAMLCWRLLAMLVTSSLGSLGSSTSGVSSTLYFNRLNWRLCLKRRKIFIWGSLSWLLHLKQTALPPHSLEIWSERLGNMIGEIWKYDRKDLEIWSERFGIWMERFGNMIWEIQYNLNTSIDISDGKIQITTPTQRACLDSTKQCEPTEPRFYPGEFVTLLVATSVHVLAQEFSLFGCTQA